MMGSESSLSRLNSLQSIHDEWVWRWTHGVERVAVVLCWLASRLCSLHVKLGVLVNTLDIVCI